MGRRRSSPLNKLFAWVRRQSMKVKTFLTVTAVLTALVALKLLIRDHNHFFVASEAIHAAGIIVLIYKLSTQKTCCGDIHTVLDFATLLSTAWVVYMIRFKLKSTYTEELDNMAMYYMVIPSAILAILIHPYTQHSLISRMLWAFCVYLESVSVLPQLRLIQNAKMVEPFTAHYVFALGVARFLGCAHWIIQVYDSAGKYLFLVGSGYLWLPMVLLSEIVQTFILADFCYYYIKSVVNGQLLMSLPPV
ncbi:ER lumen protein retaining receptor family protein [Actinidia rufa]|uniref:ER lumen protein retaining receptor family protein n=1 Tax=Actinidia rufa TaxID=165716 RepID=A0A7J0FML2_9ERIC|nr:ER lumen protein retaining receptor family protein [Actinidia rufa]